MYRFAASPFCSVFSKKNFIFHICSFEKLHFDGLFVVFVGALLIHFVVLFGVCVCVRVCVCVCMLSSQYALYRPLRRPLL